MNTDKTKLLKVFRNLPEISQFFRKVNEQQYNLSVNKYGSNRNRSFGRKNYLLSRRIKLGSSSNQAILIYETLIMIG